jgi:hypothetical protein
LGKIEEEKSGLKEEWEDDLEKKAKEKKEISENNLSVNETDSSCTNVDNSKPKREIDEDELDVGLKTNTGEKREVDEDEVDMKMNEVKSVTSSGIEDLNSVKSVESKRSEIGLGLPASLGIPSTHHLPRNSAKVNLASHSLEEATKGRSMLSQGLKSENFSFDIRKMSPSASMDKAGI